MKNVFLSLIITFAFLAAANAQGRYSMQGRVQQLKDSLALSNSQVSAIDSIYAQAREKFQNISASGQERRQAMREIMLDTNAAIEKILTDEQRVKYEKMLTERKSIMRGRHHSEGN